MSTLLEYAKRRMTRAYCNRKPPGGSIRAGWGCALARSTIQHGLSHCQQPQLLSPYIVQVERAAAGKEDVHAAHVVHWLRRDVAREGTDQVDVSSRRGVGIDEREVALAPLEARTNLERNVLRCACSQRLDIDFDVRLAGQVNRCREGDADPAAVDGVELQAVAAFAGVVSALLDRPCGRLPVAGRPALGASLEGGQQDRRSRIRLHRHGEGGCV